MKSYKILILGPQCSGKTTFVRYLRKKDVDLPLVEEDEIFTKLNNGIYPQDIVYKENVLRPKLEEEIKNTNNIIFITSYCNPDLLKELKSKGFKIAQFVLDESKLEERNEKRMKEHGYDDARKWLKENLQFHQKMRDKGLVDKVVDTDRPVEEIAKDILDYIR